MDKLLHLLKEYLDLRLATAQLTIQRDVIQLLTLLIRGMLLVACVFSAVFWLSFGLAWWLAERVGWGFGGYTTVATLYGLLGLLVYFRRKALQHRVENVIRAALPTSLLTPPPPPLNPEAHAPQPGRTTETDPKPTGR